MSYSHLTDQEFRQRHAAHIASPGWKAFRRKALAFYAYRCAVCGDAYRKRWSQWQLIVDHRQYWKDGRLIFGHETVADVRLLCPIHNEKGVRGDDVIRTQRLAYLLFAGLGFLLLLPLRLVWRLLRVRRTARPPQGER